MKTNWVAPGTGATPTELRAVAAEVVRARPDLRDHVVGAKLAQAVLEDASDRRTRLAISSTGSGEPYDLERIAVAVGEVCESSIEEIACAATQEGIARAGTAQYAKVHGGKQC